MTVSPGAPCDICKVRVQLPGLQRAKERARTYTHTYTVTHVTELHLSLSIFRCHQPDLSSEYLALGWSLAYALSFHLSELAVSPRSSKLKLLKGSKDQPGALAQLFFSADMESLPRLPWDFSSIVRSPAALNFYLGCAQSAIGLLDSVFEADGLRGPPV